MRLTLSDEQVLKLLKLLEKRNKVMYENILSQYNESKSKDLTSKQNATKQANLNKVNKSKRLVQDAINILLLEGKKINASTVSKQAGISYITATKYLHSLTK